jgi:TRAP transporter TAXI family solute receptor
MYRTTALMASVGLLFHMSGLQGAAAQLLTIGANPPGSMNYSTAAAVSQAIMPKTGMQLRVQPFAGSTVAMILLHQGEIDLAFNTATETILIYDGDPAVTKQRADNLRVVASMMPLVAAFYVKKDSPVRAMAHLKGKRVPGGYLGQRALDLLSEAIYANAGFALSEVEIRPVPNVVRGADDFVGGSLDAFYFAVGGAKVKEVDAMVGGVRAIGLDDRPEAIARMKKVAPASYPVRVVPSPQNVGVGAPTVFLAQDFVLLASVKLADEMVYRIAKAIHESRDAMLASFAPLAAFDPAKMASEFPTVPYHPGALRFYREIGLRAAN